MAAGPEDTGNQKDTGYRPPRVSVVMPVFNVERYVREAVESVLQQSETNLELIVVDDGSTDQTSAIVQMLAKQDPRVRVFRQQNSGRPSIARNRGIRMARGELIGFLDGDDIYLKERIAKAVAIFDRYSDVDVVFHDIKRLTQNGEILAGTYLTEFKFTPGTVYCLTPLGERTYRGNDRFYSYVSSVFSPFLMPAIMVRRSRLECEPYWFREDLYCGEDIDLWFRLVKDNRVVYIDEVLSAYRYRPDSTTQNKEEFYRGTLEAHRNNLARAEAILTSDERDRYRRRIAERYQHLAYLYLGRAEPGKARCCYSESWSIKRDFRIILRLLRTFIPNSVMKGLRLLSGRSS